MAFRYCNQCEEAFTKETPKSRVCNNCKEKNKLLRRFANYTQSKATCYQAMTFKGQFVGFISSKDPDEVKELAKQSKYKPHGEMFTCH